MLLSMTSAMMLRALFPVRGNSTCIGCVSIQAFSGRALSRNTRRRQRP